MPTCLYITTVLDMYMYVLACIILCGELSPIMTCPKIEIGYNSREKCSLNILIFSNGSVQKPEELSSPTESSVEAAAICVQVLYSSFELLRFN